MSPWYLNPAWYALAVSVVALAVSLWTFKFARRAKRAEIVQRLIQQAADINESFARHGIKGPYAQRLGIADADVPTFTAKAAIFLNHINLLRGVFDTRDVLGKQGENAYLNWVKTVVKPWVEADQHLKDTWKFLRESEDLVGRDFIRWLCQYMGSSDEPER